MAVKTVSNIKQNKKHEIEIEIGIPSKEKIGIPSKAKILRDKKIRMFFHLCAYFVCNTLFSVTLFIPSSYFNDILRMAFFIVYLHDVLFVCHPSSLIQNKCLRISLIIILTINTLSFVLSSAACIRFSRWLSQDMGMLHMSICAIVFGIYTALIIYFLIIICIEYYAELQSEEDQKSRDCKTGINSTEKSRPLHILINMKDLDNHIEHKVIQLNDKQCCVVLFPKKIHETKNTQRLVEFPKIVTKA